MVGFGFFPGVAEGSLCWRVWDGIDGWVFGVLSAVRVDLDVLGLDCLHFRFAVVLVRWITGWPFSGSAQEDAHRSEPAGEGPPDFPL